MTQLPNNVHFMHPCFLTAFARTEGNRFDCVHLIIYQRLTLSNYSKRSSAYYLQDFEVTS